MNKAIILAMLAVIAMAAVVEIMRQEVIRLRSQIRAYESLARQAGAEFRSNDNEHDCVEVWSAVGQFDGHYCLVAPSTFPDDVPDKAVCSMSDGVTAYTMAPRADGICYSEDAEPVSYRTEFKPGDVKP